MATAKKVTKKKSAAKKTTAKKKSAAKKTTAKKKSAAKKTTAKKKDHYPNLMLQRKAGLQEEKTHNKIIQLI